MPANFARSTTTRRRVQAVVANAANSLLQPFSNLLVSLLVVRLASPELWGQVVSVLVVVQVAVQVIAWGNKNYLLRTFSQNPAHIGSAWRDSMAARMLLLFPYAAILALVGYTEATLALVFLWTLGLVFVQAYEVFVLYYRDFTFALAVEAAALAFMVLGVILLSWFDRLALEVIFALFSLATAAKAGVYAWRFRRQTLQLRRADQPKLKRWGVGFRYFVAAFPFFLLAISGMLASKADLYVVTALLPGAEIAKYQVLTSLLIYLQAVSNFVLLPFVRAIYRLDDAVVLKMATRLLLFGLIILGPGLVAIYLVIVYLYGFSIAPALLLLGGLMVLPTYYYSTIVYALFRDQREATVVRISWLGIAVSSLGSLALLPRLGISGALLAATGAQWVMLLAYVRYSLAMMRSLQTGSGGAA